MQPDFRRPHEPSRRPATLDPLRRRGGVVTQRPAKPFTPVRFRSAPLLGDTRFCGSCSPSLLAVADRPGTEMVRYLIRRLLWAIVTLILVSFVTFLIFYVLPPGDPAVLRAGHLPNPQLLINIRHALGLDRPFWVQYWDYIRAIVLHFDFGFSYQFEAPVSTLIMNHLPATISLTVGATIVWLAIGLPIGVISAIRRRTILDRVAMGGAL